MPSPLPSCNLRSGKPITDLRDYNRDGKVTSSDSLLVFANLGGLKRLDLSGATQTLAIPQSDRSTSDLLAAPLAAVAFGVTPVSNVDRSTSQADASTLVLATYKLDSPRATKEMLQRPVTAVTPLNERAVALAFASSKSLLRIGCAGNETDREGESSATEDDAQDWFAWR